MNDFDIGRSPEPPDEIELVEGYEIEASKLWKAIDNAIGLYQENIDLHGMDKIQARRASVSEVMDGIDYDTPTFARQGYFYSRKGERKVNDETANENETRTDREISRDG